jgi:hypothetical protein
MQSTDTSSQVGVETEPRPASVSARWRAIFRIEIPICAATVVYWIVAPEHYVRKMFGDVPIDVGHRYLVLQAASTVATLLVWFYGRVLFAPSIDLRTFRYLQEGMAIGDLGILALSGYLAIAGHPDPATLVAQVIMATLWGGLRIVFLWTHKAATPAQLHGRR